MKCTIPEISWHNREPVLSVDIFPENRDFYKLASGGGDCHVLIWQMNITENGAVNQEVISDLTRHQRAVNCVRWSHTGQYLASGDDDANIIVWQLKTDNIPLLEDDTGDKEIWIVYKVLRGHKEDVYDICWSMDEAKIFSGSVDNTAILWDVKGGKMDHILSDHKGFVQGVAWDPKNQIIATISTDRICRIFDPFGKQIKARIHKGKLLVPDSHYLKDKEVKFFHDDTFKSFFRRLHFTPDGSLLIVPSGHIEADNCKDVLNATLIFTLDNFISPAIILPIPHQSSTVVRCCPVLFELKEHGPDPIIKLPYRMIFAVATDHDIILYDTQQTVPFARFQDIHYTRLTDLTWSKDGLLLIASSTDGFCSLITFEMDELGVPWVKMESEGEENQMDVSGCEELVDRDENIDINNKAVVEEQVNNMKEDYKEESKKRASFLEQWAIRTPKKKKLNPEEKKSTNDTEKASEIIEILDSPVKTRPAEDDSCGTIGTENGEQKIKKSKPEEVSVCQMRETESTEQKEKISTVNKLIPRRINRVNTSIVVKKPETNNQQDCGKSKEIEHISIPKGLKPKLVRSEVNPNQDNNIASCSIQKEGKLSDNEDAELINKSESETSSDSENEQLSKDELVELHKASENIKEFFCRIPKKKDSDGSVNVIAVRKKPREGNNIVNVKIADCNLKNDNNMSTVNKFSDAKPIEVRRKPRDPGTIQKAQISEDKAVAKNHLDAKPIHIKIESKDIHPEKCTNISNLKDTTSEKVGKECNKKESKVQAEKAEPYSEDSNNEEKHTKSKNITDNTAENKAANDIVVIESEDEEYNTTPKKSKSSHSISSKKCTEEGPPKIKVSSLVKKTTETPKKQNALLNFLQKSAEKKPKKKKVDDVVVDLRVEENEARDAWKCDSKQESEQNPKKNDTTSKKMEVDDDETEDFCLRLEDSQEGCDEQKSESQLSEKCQTRIDKPDEIKTSTSGQLSENKNKEVSGNVHNIEESCITSSNALPKTPRRVTLITLASPKSNKTKK